MSSMDKLSTRNSTWVVSFTFKVLFDTGEHNLGSANSFITMPVLMHCSIATCSQYFGKRQQLCSLHTTQTWLCLTFGFSPFSKYYSKEEYLKVQKALRRIWQANYGESKKAFVKCFQQWKYHWEKYVASERAYFEGDWDFYLIGWSLLFFFLNRVQIIF